MDTGIWPNDEWRRSARLTAIPARKGALKQRLMPCSRANDRIGLGAELARTGAARPPAAAQCSPTSSRESNVARPRKLKKPLTSVTVVRMMDEAVAGSRLSAVSTIGTEQPATAAITIEQIMELPITRESPKLRLHKKLHSAVTSA